MGDLPELYEDPLDTKSKRGGITGLIETFLRRFRSLSFAVLILPIVFIYIISLSLAVLPGVFYFNVLIPYLYPYAFIYQILALSFVIALGIFSFGATLFFIIPLFNLPFLFILKPFRGTWYSLQTVPWYYHNALMQLARYTFLDYINPTPLTVLFFKMMGMKIGKGCVINTSNISDPCLVELGDYVTIGGSATIFAHYGMKGYLIVEKTILKDKVTLGLKASVMGDVIIEEGITIPPHKALLPKSRILSNKQALEL